MTLLNTHTPRPITSSHLVQGLITDRGEPQTWRSMTIRAGLALAIIDAVMSPRIRIADVDAILQRYCAHYCESDGPAALVQSFHDLSGCTPSPASAEPAPTEAWQDSIGTKHRTYASRDAPHKADVIFQAASLLAAENIESVADLHSRVHAESGAAGPRAVWCALPGQSSGVSWRHLLGATGYPEPLICPLTRTSARRWAGCRGHETPADADILNAMAEAASDLGQPVLAIDHQMWRAAKSPLRS